MGFGVADGRKCSFDTTNRALESIFTTTLLMSICDRFLAVCDNYRRTTLKGKRTDPQFVHEIRKLRRVHRPAEIVKIMDGRLHRRTVYRWLKRLAREDEERWREDAERVRRALERSEAKRIRRARMRGARPFRTVAQFPPRARVRAE